MAVRTPTQSEFSLDEKESSILAAPPGSQMDFARILVIQMIKRGNTAQGAAIYVVEEQPLQLQLPPVRIFPEGTRVNLDTLQNTMGDFLEDQKPVELEEEIDTCHPQFVHTLAKILLSAYLKLNYFLQCDNIFQLSNLGG